MKYAEGPPKLVAWLAQASNKPHSRSHAKTMPILSDYKVGGGGLSDEFSGLEVALIEPLFCVLSARALCLTWILRNITAPCPVFCVPCQERWMPGACLRVLHGLCEMQLHSPVGQFSFGQLLVILAAPQPWGLSQCQSHNRLCLESRHGNMQPALNMSSRTLILKAQRSLTSSSCGTATPFSAAERMTHASSGMCECCENRCMNGNCHCHIHIRGYASVRKRTYFSPVCAC
jgi:hypothetical protein